DLAVDDYRAGSMAPLFERGQCFPFPRLCIESLHVAVRRYLCATFAANHDYFLVEYNGCVTRALGGDVQRLGKRCPLAGLEVVYVHGGECCFQNFSDSRGRRPSAGYVDLVIGDDCLHMVTRTWRIR